MIFLRRLATGPRRWHLIALMMICATTFAACGGDNSGTNPGVDLGSGNLLAFIGGDGNLYLARADGSNAHRVTQTPCTADVHCFGPPAWSPDGQHVALFGPNATQNGNNIYIYDRHGLLTKTIQPINSQSSGNLLWAHDSKTLGYAGSANYNGTPSLTPTPNLYALILVDANTGAAAGNIPLPAPKGADVQCSDAGRGGALGSLVNVVIQGSNTLRSTFDWSSDGQRILISSGPCLSSVSIVTKGGPSDGQNLAPVTPGAQALQAAFSADGQHIVAMQTQAAADDLLIYDGNGQNGKIILTDTSTPPDFAPRIGSPVFSADGKTIYFMRDADLWAVSADGSNPHKIATGQTGSDLNKAEIAPLPSPDGKSLVWVEASYSQNEGQPRATLKVANTEGASPVTVNDGGIWPAWS